MKAPALRTVFSRLWESRRQLVVFALFFRLFEGLLFSPVAAVVGRTIAGRPVVDSTGLLSFALSPRGFAAIALGVIAAFTIRLAEHAGLSAICLGAAGGQRIPARRAFALVVARLPRLVHVAARFAATGLLALLPLLAVAGIGARRLLSKHDINYYLAELPTQFVDASLLTGSVALLTTLLLLWLFARWRWVVQANLFQARPVPQAFVESTLLTRGLRGKLALASLASAVLGLGLAVGGAALACWISGIVLPWFGQGALALGAAFALLYLLRLALVAAATLAGSCIDAGYFTAFHGERLKLLGETTALPPDLAAEKGAGTPDRATAARRFALLAAFVLAAAAAAGAFAAADALGRPHPVSVTAHRGNCLQGSPENTVAAVLDAARAGADTAEIDVQMSKDGALVVTHDSDFSRVAKVPRKVWELSLEEIRAIPLAGQPGGGAGVPTLQEVLAAADGVIRLNIELKYYGKHQPGLAGKVAAAVERAGMAGEVMVQCLEYEPLLEVRRAAPAIPVGYLMSFNARQPARLKVDFLSVEAGRLDLGLVAAAHRRGQRVLAWTVDRRPEMERLLDLGIDGLITNRPDLAAEVAKEHAALRRHERAARRIRAWLAP